MPIAQACDELGLNAKTVNDWALKRRRELSGEPDPRAEDRELREAKKRICELKMENAFLKKAAAFFAKEKHSSQVRARVAGER
ncbi:MAG TPA: hypothetical protein OIL77_08630 [Coriobacteriaceae bacterium]|nr:hypothetical protein [Coriobacteriaceae bacterium]